MSGQSTPTTERSRAWWALAGLGLGGAMGLGAACDDAAAHADRDGAATADPADADAAVTFDVGAEVGADVDPEVDAGRVDRGTLAWPAPLALCTTWAPGQTLEVAARSKVRLTLPPRDYRDLTAATLATPLVDVLVETGPFAGEQAVVAPGPPTLRYDLADPDLTAEAVFDFGALGTLTEAYSLHRRDPRIDPLSSRGELTFLWKRGPDVRLLVPCDGFEDTEPAAAVLQLTGPAGQPPASLLAFYDTSPPTQVATHHHLKILQAVVADEVPFVATAAGWPGLTYAANDPDHQDATVADLERDLASWQRYFRPAARPLTAPRVSRIALHDVGVWLPGQSIGTVDVTRRHPDDTTSTWTYAASAWRRVDAIYLARELGDKCAPIDDTVSLYIGALGPLDRRLQVVACRKLGSPFQRNLIAVIPLAWRSAPELVGVALARTDQVITDATGATIAVGPDRVRIEPRDGDTFRVEIRDGDGALVYESLGPQEPVADPRPRRSVVGGVAPGVSFALGLLEIERSGGAATFAPEYARLDAGARHVWVADWTRLAYTGSPDDAADAADITTEEGDVIRWRRAPGADGAAIEQVDLVAADGTVLIPPTTLEPR